MTAPLFATPPRDDIPTGYPVRGCFQRRATIRGLRRLAIYSRDERYRYALEIRWADGELAQFIGCNPSTATELEDDPTIRKCIAFAQRWGRAGLLMTNVCAFRATDANVMLAARDPIGPGNTPKFLEAFADGASGASLVLGCWGDHPLKRPELWPHVADIKRVFGRRLLALRLTKGGHPIHPLYQRADLEPRPFADLACELVQAGASAR